VAGSYILPQVYGVLSPSTALEILQAAAAWRLSSAHWVPRGATQGASCGPVGLQLARARGKVRQHPL